MQSRFSQRFNDAIRSYWDNYFNFRDDASVIEMYAGVFVYLLCAIIIHYLTKILYHFHLHDLGSAVFIILMLAITIPFLAVFVRRELSAGWSYFGIGCVLVLLVILLLWLGASYHLFWWMGLVLFGVVTIIPPQALQTQSDNKLMLLMFQAKDDR